MSTSKKHDWLVNKIYDHPELVSISSDDILAKTQEQSLLYRGHLLTIPDIYILSSLKDNYIEVKSENSQFLYNKGMSQLEKICRWSEIHKPCREFDAKLVMPQGRKYDTWIDMLHELKFYTLGDSFDSPRYF